MTCKYFHVLDTFQIVNPWKRWIAPRRRVLFGATQAQRIDSPGIFIYDAILDSGFSTLYFVAGQPEGEEIKKDIVIFRAEYFFRSNKMWVINQENWQYVSILSCTVK